MVERRGPKEKWGSTKGKNRRIKNLTDDSEKPVGEWNNMVIECVDREVRVWVNGDFVNDNVDNCIDAANPTQTDSNGDGFGNACDADLNGDCIVNPIDLGLFRAVFFSSDADADFNGDGVVNPIDLGILRSQFFQAPGPSGVPTPGCP